MWMVARQCERTSCHRTALKTSEDDEFSVRISPQSKTSENTEELQEGRWSRVLNWAHGLRR